MKKQMIKEKAHIVREDAHQAKEDAKANIKNAKKTKVILSLLKLLLLLVIVVGIPLYVTFYHRDFLARFNSFDDIILFMQIYKAESIFVYIGVQIMQIVISIIPGQAFQFAAGYLYTFFPGLLYSIIGATLGTAISFYLAKLLGKDAMHLLFGEERMNYFIQRLNSKKAYTIVFLIYLIPGFPKDLLSYAAGVSEMKFKPFLVFSLVGRLPGMSGSLLIGALYLKEHYIGMAIVGILAVVAFIVCIIFRKKLDLWLDRFYEKLK